jgi:hypothetical protein
MRTPSLYLLALAFAFSSTALAAPSVTPASAEADAIPLQTVHGKSYKVPYGLLALYKGEYRTDKGEVLRVSFEHRKLFASIDRQTKVELVPVADNTFVTRDEQNKIVFDPLAD